MLGCLCKALLREEGVTHLQKWRNLKSKLLSSISVRRECLPRKLIMTSWKPLERSLLQKPLERSLLQSAQDKDVV